MDVSCELPCPRDTRATLRSPKSRSIPHNRTSHQQARPGSRAPLTMLPRLGPSTARPTVPSIPVPAPASNRTPGGSSTSGWRLQSTTLWSTTATTVARNALTTLPSLCWTPTESSLLRTRLEMPPSARWLLTIWKHPNQNVQNKPMKSCWNLSPLRTSWPQSDSQVKIQACCSQSGQTSSVPPRAN